MNDIDLSLTRNTDTKNIDTPIVFKPEDFRKHFEDSVDALNKQFATADWLISIGKKSEAEDVWRSQIVFLSSAFDFYMHELTRYGLSQIYANDEHWPETDGYMKISIPLSDFQKALSSDDDIGWFSDFIIRRYSHITMMDPQTIKEQMSLIGLSWKKVATSVFHDMSSRVSEEKKFTSFLANLYKRRNSIAHQSDREFSDASTHFIEEKDVREYVATVSEMVKAVDVELRCKNSEVI